MASQDDDYSLLETPPELAGLPQAVCSPWKEKWEKDLTEALLEISEKTLEDDQKAVECLIGTGWEEAACGWGPLSATAGLHPPKKMKQLKAGEAADCILCQDLCHISESKDTAAETKPNTVTTHKDKAGTSGADHVLHPAEKDVKSGFTGHCPSPATVSKTEPYDGKVSSVDIASGEHRQNKDKNFQRSSSPFPPGRAIPICTNCYNPKEPLTFNALMLLPPLKATAGNGHIEQMARRKEILLQQLVKFPSNGFMGTTLMGQVLHNIDQRLEKKLLDAMSSPPEEQPRVSEPLSFISSCIPKTPLKNAERLRWQYSLLAQKSTAVNANSVKHSTSSAPVGFLHTRTMQNKRSNRQEVRHLNNTKVRSAKSGSSRVPDTVLPSLTVTRVEIPVKMKLC